MQELVATALFNKGVTLRELRRFEAAIAVYDDLVTRFGDAQESGVQELVATALLNKGVRLGELGRVEAMITIFDDLIIRFGDASEPQLRELVARVREIRNKIRDHP